MKKIGIGKSEKGTLTHVLMGQRKGLKRGYALCDPRMKGLLVDNDLDPIAGLTCKKCTSKVKNLMDKPPAKKSPVKKSTQKKKAEPKEKKVIPEDPKVKVEEPKKEQNGHPQKPLKQFYMSLNQKKEIDIYHKPSGRAWFKNLPQELGAEIFGLLQSLTIGWDGKNSVPKEFTSATLNSYKVAHENLDLDLPDVFKEREKKREEQEKEQKEKEEKSGRKIARRDHKKGQLESKIKITRRSKPKSESLPVTNISRRKENPTSLIRRMLRDGATMETIMNSLEIKFNFGRKRALGKFKRALRQFRKQRKTIIHHLKHDPKDDYYIFKVIR